MAEDFISRPRPRTWDQGQGLCYQGQGHCFLSSRRLKDEAKSSRTHHWLTLTDYIGDWLNVILERRNSFAETVFLDATAFSHYVKFLQNVSIACYAERCTSYRKSTRLSNRQVCQFPSHAGFMTQATIMRSSL